MKPAEKAVLRAGMVGYLQAQVRRETRILEQVRVEMHLLRSKKPSARPVTLTDWEGYRGIVTAQIMVVRRAKLALEAAMAWQRVDREWNDMMESEARRQEWDDPYGLTDAETPEDREEQHRLNMGEAARLDALDAERDEMTYAVPDPLLLSRDETDDLMEGWPSYDALDQAEQVP